MEKSTVAAEFHWLSSSIKSLISTPTESHRRGYTIHEFDVVIIEDETGGYVAFVPALPGCHTQGDTQEELIENIKEAIELYIETLMKDEKKELLQQRVVGIQKVKALA